MKVHCDQYIEEALELYLDSELSGNKSAVAKFLHHKYSLLERISLENFRRSLSNHLDRKLADRELVEQNVKLSKQKQKGQDINRIERKSFREYARVENAVAEFGKALVEQNKIYGKELSKINIKPLKKKGGGTGIIQITDVHGNELIDLPNNKYDFEILSRRLKKLVNESINYFNYKGARKVLIAFTGDLLNSDRRLDELLNQATNRSKASILMVHILKQAILEVRNAGFQVDIVSVLGNESRVNKEMTFSKEAFSDNYDFTIIAQLKELFEFSNIKGVTFHEHDNLETVVKIEGQRWLLKHNLDKSLDKQKNTQSTIGKHALKGSLIHFSIGGHIHAHNASDIGCRSGSMSGSNSYNENSLDLMGRASGVCYYVTGNERYYQYIDLQETSEEGYEIVKQLEAYNAKSISKIKPHKTVFEVVI